MGNGIGSRQLESMKQDIYGQEEKFIESCLKVLLLRDDLIDDTDCTFRGMKLTAALIQSKLFPEIENTEQAVFFIQDTLMNPNLNFQLIYPKCDNKSFYFIDCQLYMFIEDKFNLYRKENYVLNLPPTPISVNSGKQDLESQSKQSYPFFYNREVLKEPQYQLLNDPRKLIAQIKEVFQKCKVEASNEDGSCFDYIYLGSECSLWMNDFTNLVNLLPYLDLTKIQNDEAVKKSAFINLYNVLLIHSYVFWGLNKDKNLKICPPDRKTIFQSIKYNIGGKNYSMDDIEHGILRDNDNVGDSFLQFLCQMAFKQTLSDRSKPRFSRFDPRKNMLVKGKDPRIHFALNCGAKSCPRVKVYEGPKIESQLELAAKTFINANMECQQTGTNKLKIIVSKIFQWYHDDFSTTDQGLLSFLSKYANPVNKELLTKAASGEYQFVICFGDYDWSPNFQRKKNSSSSQN